uniref:Uncharacterized protein n=1 Tax=Candidatus Kentrum sp. LFY TaxID=2126342 RepID=A0A450UUA6_9GAMM|nr:MAG: hypothetical protein BECKLFY1418B_GA0070995_10811 [Candidatus Kentron sp. LFY]
MPPPYPLVVRRLTGIDKDGKHRGRYHWFCHSDKEPRYLPVVRVRLPEKCEPVTEGTPVPKGKNTVSTNFEAGSVLRYAKGNGPRTDTDGYIPQSWEGLSCGTGLVTKGFVEDGRSHALSVGGANDLAGLSTSLSAENTPTFHFSVPRGLPEIRFKDENSDCKWTRGKYSDSNDLIEIYCSHRYFHLQGLTLPNGARLFPKALRAQGQSSWSPCKELPDKKDSYRCEVDVDPDGLSSPKGFQLRLHRKLDSQETKAEIPIREVRPNHRPVALAHFLEDRELPVTHSQGQGWLPALFDDKDCLRRSRSDAKSRANQWMRLSRVDDPGYSSACVSIPADALDIEGERLVRKVNFTEFYRRVALPKLPEAVSWRPGYTLRWKNLPDTCKESKVFGGKEPPRLLCKAMKDASYSDREQWPRFTITDTEKRDVFTAILNLSDLSEPRLSDERYVYYFKNLAHLFPDKNNEQACEPDTNTSLWRCETAKIMQRLAIEDRQDQTTTISVPPDVLEPGGVHDWTKWLTEPLPLIWEGEGGFLVRFPKSHGRELQLYGQLDCKELKDTSGTDTKYALYLLQDPKADGFRGIKHLGSSLRLRLGSSLRLMGSNPDQRTKCVSLTGENLRIENGKLKFAFTLQPKDRELQADERLLLIVDVSDRMAQYSKGILNALRDYDPPTDGPITLGLMGNRLYVQAHSEDFDAATFRVDIERLQFNHHPEDLLTFLALALEPFQGTRGHRLRILLSPRWAELPDGFQYPVRSTGYLERVLKILEIQVPIDLYLLAGGEGNCGSLRTSLPQDLRNRFTCSTLPTDRIDTFFNNP